MYIKVGLEVHNQVIVKFLYTYITRNVLGRPIYRTLCKMRHFCQVQQNTKTALARRYS